MANLELNEIEQNMKAAGVAVDEPAYEDYFGFNETRVWYFPDEVQYIEYKLMNEGARSKYQEKTSTDIRLMKQSGDASIRVNPAVERTILFEESVIGWNVFRKNPISGNYEHVPFGTGATIGSEFGKWRMTANPKLVADLELAIRKANPWMQADMSVDEIDKEIVNLQELREAAVKREEGKDGS